jgi:hypothetical protein
MAEMEYASPPETIARARRLMDDIRAALTRGLDGEFPIEPYDWWDCTNIKYPEKAWQDMDAGERRDLLRHALDEEIRGLVRPARPGELSDSEKLAKEFVKAEAGPLAPTPDPAHRAQFQQPDDAKGLDR